MTAGGEVLQQTGRMLDFDGARVRMLGLLAAHADAPVLLGITGEPGSGKTTLAERLLAEALAAGIPAAHVPMDGFHLADASLTRLGRLGRKGAIDTFDGWGYRELLRRIAARSGASAGEPIYAPGFERTLEQPIAGSIAVGPDVALVVTEGNYLLADEEPWRAAHALLTETWFCRADPAARVERLVDRHIRFGKTEAAARAWVRNVDEPNAAAILATSARADAEVDCD